MEVQGSSQDLFPTPARVRFSKQSSFFISKKSKFATSPPPLFVNCHVGTLEKGLGLIKPLKEDLALSNHTGLGELQKWVFLIQFI